MSQNKNNSKKFESFTEGINNTRQYMAIGMMATAAMLGLAEFSNHEAKAAIVASQPVYATPETSEDPNPMRRERDETHPHASSFSATQRTPGRTGKA